MTSALMKAIAPHLHINYNWKNEEHTEIEILETGHKQHGKTIRKKLRENVSASTINAFEKHFDKSFEDAVHQCIPPVVILFLAAEEITEQQLVDSILAAPKDAEIVVNQIKEEDFQAALFRSYEKLSHAQSLVTEERKEAEPPLKMPVLANDAKKILENIFKGYGIPSYEKIASAVEEAGDLKGKAQAIQATFNKFVEEKGKEVSSLQTIINNLKTEYESRAYAELKVTGDGTIPSGKVEMKPAKELFPGVTDAEFLVPCWVWDGVHPEVPAKDPHYIFREELLIRALYAIATNQRMYLQGHTGSGKTTLIEQIAAHLNWPFMRINFDSEITRMDLIGRDTLKDGESVFVDGMLPKMMQAPYIGVFDEIDFCRPDVAYVMQSVLEGNSFRITEDGGRLVEPNPMFRMFATGNTVGQGDEHGMYQGARPQSLAFLDRFTVWGKVEYLQEQERETLIKRHFPMLSEDAVKTINKYATEHLAAFEQAKILQPISPRGILAVARAASFQVATIRNVNQAIKQSLTMSILDRCTASDYAVIKGIIDRVVK